jgi:hypothetical protein
MRALILAFAAGDVYYGSGKTMANGYSLESLQISSLSWELPPYNPFLPIYGPMLSASTELPGEKTAPTVIDRKKDLLYGGKAMSGYRVWMVFALETMFSGVLIFDDPISPVTYSRSGILKDHRSAGHNSSCSLPPPAWNRKNVTRRFWRVCWPLPMFLFVNYFMEVVEWLFKILNFVRCNRRHPMTRE